MADINYESKFSEMQKYIPFLDRVIEKLKNSDQDKPRKAQLEKMQTLHSLLHNKEKKLKIETLLKCETVLKKLHAKIEKSDDVIPSNPHSNSTTTNISSNTAAVTETTKKVHITALSSPSTKNKFVPNRNLIEIHTCPASPTHLGEEDFRPPVEIPTERRSSPVKLVSSPRWDQQCKKSSKEIKKIGEPLVRPPISSAVRIPQNRSADVYHSNNTSSSSHHVKFTDAPKGPRWSDPRDRVRNVSPSSSSSSPSSSYHRSSWSSTTTSNNQRSQHNTQKRNEPKYSSEEENWDEPEDEPLPNLKPVPKPTSSPTFTTSSYSSHIDTKNTHYHRLNDNKSYKSQSDRALPPLPPPSPIYPPLPDDKDAFQNKIYHDTIYKYKKSEPHNTFMNPPAPEQHMPKHLFGNIFNRLGEKVDVESFENFSIQVKNDKIKAKPQQPPLPPLPLTLNLPPPPPPPLLVTSKPIGEVLKSPPLSADDIDELLNESLEAAMEKQTKIKTNDFSMKGSQAHSLDAVRKKLALISRPPTPPQIESPTSTENTAEEPFYRRGHTPVKKTSEVVLQKKVETQTGGAEESIKCPLLPTSKNFLLPSPKSPPPNAMETVVERLALKYNPHKRRESVSIERNYTLQTEKTNVPALQMKDSVDLLAHRSKQLSHRESMVSPVHIVDPRMSKKMMGQIPSLMSLPISPIPNVLPAINHFDPRLRNTHPLNKDHVPFSVPKPFHGPIPSLLDLHVNIPLPAPPLPNFNSPKPPPPPNYSNVSIPSQRIDPRTQKSSKSYVDKFNPERNDKTERMKYLESKRNKPPEPKTYGEYRQSKNRQQVEEGDGGKVAQTTETLSSPVAPSIQSMVPSTLDKMYRNADYGKEITAGSMQGFKIPKKPKPEVPKTPDPPKNDNQGLKSLGEEVLKNESVCNIDQTSAKKTQQKPEENISNKKSDIDNLEPAKKLEETQKINETQKPIVTEKVTKHNDKNLNKSQDVDSKRQVIPETKKKKTTTKAQVVEYPPLIEVENAAKKSSKTPVDVETNKQSQEIDCKNETKVSGSESVFDALKCDSETPLDDSIIESRLVIDEGESPIKSKDEQTIAIDESDASPEPRIIRSRKKKNVIKDDTPSPEIKTKEKPTEDDTKVEKELKNPEKEEFVPRRITTRRSTILMREQLAAEQIVAEQIAAEKIAAEKLAAEKIEQENIAAEKIASEKIGAEKTAAEKTAAEKTAAEKTAAKKIAAKKIAEEKIAEEQIPAEKMDTNKNESASEIQTRRRSASDIFSPTTDNSVVSTQNIISGKRRTRATINFNEKNTKKPATPKTGSTSASSPASSITHTPKTRRAAKATDSKQEAKKNNKVTSVADEKQKDIDIEKKKSEDGQICAVSSTTTEVPLNHEPAIITDEHALPEEPSSSNAADETHTPLKLVDADNQKKHEFLEGFLMSIADPTTNKDRIIDMLKSVLDDKKLQQVKEILYSPVKNESKNKTEKKENEAVEEEEDHHEQTNKPRATRTKKNELDRLNDDIRDMFICQGVVTATGRRMCTIAKATSKKTPVQQPKKKIVVHKKSPTKSPVATQPASCKRRMRKAKVLISPLNMRALRNKNQKTNRSPKMPVLEPHTPIKLPVDKDNTSESDDEKIVETPKTKSINSKNKVEVNVLNKKLKKKPGPKSKRPPSDNSDSSDDDIELVYLKNKIKRLDEKKVEVEKLKKPEVEKNDKKSNKKELSIDSTKDDTTTTDEDEKEKEVICKERKSSVGVCEETPKSKPKVKLDLEIVNKERKSTSAAESDEKPKCRSNIKCETITLVSDDKPKDMVVKNTDPEYHTKSDYSNCCVICKEKARFISPHYLIAHNDSEVYTSRLPADILEEFKLNINNRPLYSLPKKPQTVFFYTCPFCDFQATHSLRGWMEHFTIHTGEYGFKCSNCFKAMNGCSHMMEHIKRFCPDAKKIIRDPINLRAQAIMGYVCHLCNFIQMLRKGVIRHLKIHHGLEDRESIASIVEVKLIDAATVPKKEEDKPKLSVNDDISTASATKNDILVSKTNEPSVILTESNKEKHLKSNDNGGVIVSNSNSIPTSVDKLAEKKSKRDENEKPSKKSKKESSLSIDSDIEETFNHRDMTSSNVIDLTELSQPTDEIIDLPSTMSVVSPLSKDNTPAPSGSEINISEISRKKPTNININIEVFLPRDRSSPTSLVLSERLKSIEKNDAIASESAVDKTKPATKKITIAEKLSQRFKNIEKQNIAEEDAIANKNNYQIEKDSHDGSQSIRFDLELVDRPETPLATSEKILELPTAVNSSMSTQSLNESDNLVIDESSTRDDDYCTDSDDGNENEEDDNWEDIEITETTKGVSQKDKNKNKSIFQTLSRLYASIAPKKSSKKIKEKEKEKDIEKEKEKKKAEERTIGQTNKPVTVTNSDPLLSTEPSKSAKKAPQQQQPIQRIPNFSDFLPGSPGDSLDMLLTANFNCLDGDGNSFPQLDLNDLDSSIFPLPEEQENIQDAIDMATNMEHIKYDVLGNAISLPVKSQQQSTPFSSSQSSSIQKIGNFGFSLNGNSLRYYCMVKSCTFLFSDHPDGLQNHFLLDHPSLKWNGYCDACKMHVGYGDCREMKHMLDVHSRTRTITTNEDSNDKPRIKFRRLTGDILSTDKPKNKDQQFPPFGNESSQVPSSHVGPTHTAISHTVSRIATSPTPSSYQTPPYHTSQSLNPPSQTATTSHNVPPSRTSELSLSTMLQSEPKAMIPPKAPPQFDIDIPLFKNVSKEFTITNVAEGVSDNDLLNLVFKQADSAPGGIQISQVISLNAGGKSVTPLPSTAQIPDRSILPPLERRNSPALKEISSSVRDAEKQSARASPKPPNPIMPSTITQQQRNSPLPKIPIPPKQTAFICCVNKCGFFSNIRSAMNEHILAHIRSENNRESLRCHVCSFYGQDTNHYFHHMNQVHSRSEALAAPSCPSTVELTQKIQDILRTTSKPNVKEQTSQAPVQVPILRPVPVTVPVVEEKKSSDREMSFPKRLREVAEEIVAPTGLSEDEIWRCIFYPECKCVVTEKDFQTHLATHTSIVPTSFPSISPGSSLHCPHCSVNYYRAAPLKSHMKVHYRHQYFCHICSCTTFLNFSLVQKHFNDIHSLAGVPRTQNLIPDDKSNNPAFLVASETELTSIELIQFGEKLIVDWERRKAVNKTHFKPNEQNLLPIQPIFNNQVYCSVCNYKTKVRTNMFRHLQLHNQDVDVGSVDPVNPVPCLEKNEKHFDKMLNLACSSNAGTGSLKSKENVKIPVFVPDMRRYVCGHPGCKYLTITDQMLRSHLNALHGQEKGYLCPHCQEEICKKNMCTERVVQHLKFHGSKMYQCSECEYFHYTRHVVERHVNEKHAGVPFVNLKTYDRSENETKKSSQLIPGRNVTSSHSASTECDSTAESPAISSSTPPNTKMKWECAICKHQTVTWNQMISHANSQHNAKHQYHCVHCAFGSAHLAHIMDHIDNKHPSKIREAKYVFYKINETLQDKAADTRPLWSRNDPKRVRSIRGILMENEEDAERTKKSLSCSGVYYDDEDEEVIAPVSDSDSSMSPGVLACFHCNYTSLEISSLSQHWKAKHWHEKNSEKVPRLPFFFRMHTLLKCPLCSHVGDHITLKIHLINSHGQRNFYATDPNAPNTCGHCPFVYPIKRMDALITHYLREHKLTDAKNLSSGLLKNLLALGECQVYMQCYFCAEICADKNSIIEHERERHKNSNFRYKQIKDEIIYRCGMCQYSSTNELATLRHMIDHFAGFNICHFCKNVQSSFNSYMQHCYSFHMEVLPGFKEIYGFEKIASFLGQMLLIFPNGLIAAKKNLLDTQYGNTERIQAMYDEICKKALEPPIPPLCMGRLLAKKSIEASSLLPPPPTTVTAKRIAKRRSTVAMGGCERGLSSSFLVPSEPQKIKKRKSSICGDFIQPTAPLFSTITAKSNNIIDNPAAERCDVVATKSSEPQGFSFYGQKPDPIDLSKIYTHIAIGDKYAPVSVKKFSLLFKINTKVMVEVMDHQIYKSKKRSANFSRPCPASKKKKFA